jgi:carboxypeptidase C (cathepsin A)
MTKNEVIAQLESAKALTSVVSIDSVILMLNKLESETGLNETVAREIVDRIETILDRNSRDLVDYDSAEFELNYNNQIELTAVDVNVHEIIEHVTDVIDSYVVVDEDEDDGCGPSETEVMQSVNEGLGTVQAAMNEFNV